MIPRIVRDFDFKLAEEPTSGNVPWTTLNYWFVKPKNFNVVVTQRRTS